MRQNWEVSKEFKRQPCRKLTFGTALLRQAVTRCLARKNFYSRKVSPLCWAMITHLLRISKIFLQVRWIFTSASSRCFRRDERFFHPPKDRTWIGALNALQMPNQPKEAWRCSTNRLFAKSSAAISEIRRKDWTWEEVINMDFQSEVRRKRQKLISIFLVGVAASFTANYLWSFFWSSIVIQ